MRFLVDECTGPGVAMWLGQQGYEVFSVYDQAQGAMDDALLLKAFSEGWILITNDKDFGEMVYRERRRHQGVIFLRLANERTASKIAVLQALLDNHVERLPGNFVVVTEDHVRFANTPNS
ncbi:DUF5615 family PIN-like protein [Armatimonas sp.]|uniref:DUF5615 family PIN-like protein n=1 Tax=Armatimonas sp. TaxID=1872638 RepID=UPI0034D963D5